MSANDYTDNNRTVLHLVEILFSHSRSQDFDEVYQVEISDFNLGFRAAELRSAALPSWASPAWVGSGQLRWPDVPFAGFASERPSRNLTDKPVLFLRSLADFVFVF